MTKVKKLELQANEYILCELSPSHMRYSLWYLLLVAIITLCAVQLFRLWPVPVGTNDVTVLASVLAAVCAFCFFLLLIGIVSLNAKKMIITNYRILLKSGLFQLYVELELYQIAKVASYRTLMNRLFSRKSGTLLLRSVDGEEGILTVPAVKQVDVVKRLILHYRKHRQDLPAVNEFVTV